MQFKQSGPIGLSVAVGNHELQCYWFVFLKLKPSVLSSIFVVQVLYLHLQPFLFPLSFSAAGYASVKPEGL